LETDVRNKSDLAKLWWIHFQNIFKRFILFPSYPKIILI